MGTEYRPRPLRTDHLGLDQSLTQLVELLSENTHEIWAQQRMSEGWTFGPERCDRRKHHPCLVPYSNLPENEKEYDRKVVLGTVRAILALGFVIEKRMEGTPNPPPSRIPG